MLEAPEACARSATIVPSVRAALRRKRREEIAIASPTASSASPTAPNSAMMIAAVLIGGLCLAGAQWWLGPLASAG
jgi:hypothetical protein